MTYLLGQHLTSINIIDMKEGVLMTNLLGQHIKLKGIRNMKVTN